VAAQGQKKAVVKPPVTGGWSRKFTDVLREAEAAPLQPAQPSQPPQTASLAPQQPPITSAASNTTAIAAAQGGQTQKPPAVNPWTKANGACV
jgi:hypothetical protein